MNVLEKILESIIDDLKEEGIIADNDRGHRAVEIIRSHMDELDDDWIPVEERLPENLEKVLVWYEYFRYGKYNCMFETYGIGWQLDGHWSGDVYGAKARCIAWQPLPEPYQLKEKNNE